MSRQIVLSKRLQHIANQVPSGTRMVDVGTDHAWLPIFLTETNQVQFAIATDVAEGPQQVARNNVHAFGLQDQIDVRLGDGLSTVEPGEVDTIVIAGMGGATARAILDARAEVVQRATHLIIQPMNAAAHVRAFMRDCGWHLIADDVIYEDGRYYQVIAARQDVDEPNDPYAPFYGSEVGMDLALEFGPTLLKHPTDTFKSFIQQTLQSWDRILREMDRSASEITERRKAALESRFMYLHQLYGAQS